MLCSTYALRKVETPFKASTNTKIDAQAVYDQGPRHHSQGLGMTQHASQCTHSVIAGSLPHMIVMYIVLPYAMICSAYSFQKVCLAGHLQCLSSRQ